MILLQHGETLTGGDDDITFGGVQLTGQDLQKVDLPAPLAPMSP